MDIATGLMDKGAADNYDQLKTRIRTVCVAQCARSTFAVAYSPLAFPSRSIIVILCSRNEPRIDPSDSDRILIRICLGRSNPAVAASHNSRLVSLHLASRPSSADHGPEQFDVHGLPFSAIEQSTSQLGRTDKEDRADRRRTATAATGQSQTLWHPRHPPFLTFTRK
ncbi:hypothetical protein BJX68DRAFT_202843 [Aspergillus pseudodeflectus]|uniref:Uncharacterized protein n=1 Tax=Aspergillus pseudodeflectus TaxID=176178 RepID=A0ABR4JFY2_9EURO